MDFNSINWLAVLVCDPRDDEWVYMVSSKTVLSSLASSPRKFPEAWYTGPGALPSHDHCCVYSSPIDYFFDEMDGKYNGCIWRTDWLYALARIRGTDQSGQ